MVKGNLATAAGKKLIKGLNRLHDILPRCKPALYLADVALSAAVTDKNMVLMTVP
ncbi:hypothetical protein HORIV_42380 [Vreelandella olivaria]|uniref:Uncharacterized protein n=1 Tax=Vreelandella olivaria TaxID=390919 RepID=A0ABM7GM93_9GAMM|nr:hypothetical protein HORIV_42380 [Halomonas olivaria]